MGTDIKAELRIPDIWYDFYARLLPGLLFVSALRYYYFDKQRVPEINEMVFLVVAAYFCGLYSQQISSHITRLVYWMTEEITNTVHDYVWSVQKKLNPVSHGAKILDKMHGEAVFFVQVFFLSLLIHCFSCIDRDARIPWFLIVALVSFIFAFGVAERRIRRAQKLESTIPEAHATAPSA